MKAAGLAFQKGRIRLSIVQSGATGIEYSAHRNQKIDANLPLPELMERYALDFRSLIQEFKPHVIAARQVWESKTLVSAFCQVAPVGLLALICRERGIDFKAYTPQSLRHPGSFNLPKGTRPIDAVDSTFGVHPPHWDSLQKDSVLVAWRSILES